MKLRLMSLMAVVIYLLAGCSSGQKADMAEAYKPILAEKIQADSGKKETQSAMEQENAETEEAEYETRSMAQDNVSLGEKFNDSFIAAEGQLAYTVKRATVFDSLEEGALTKDDFSETIDLYLDSRGQISSKWRLVLLDIEIENIDAVGWVKKEVFNINNFYLENIKNGDIYGAVYFSGASNSPVEGDPGYYRLAQGEQTELTLGYFVPAAGIEAGQICGMYADRVMLDIGLAE